MAQKEGEPKCIEQLSRTLMSLSGNIHSRLILQQRKSKRKKKVRKECTGVRERTLYTEYVLKSPRKVH